ncbi:MAG: hypothetical protein ACPLXO_04430 [Desulfurella sp.]|uniref:hypothetical protein n=1 Tax=Desulfurella sp. TaxID=1962857 RepID=UPI003CAA7C08
MKVNHLIVYLPFLIILTSFAIPIKHASYNISMPNSLNSFENLNIQNLTPQTQISIEPKEVFLLNKHDLESGNYTTFQMPNLTIISRDKSGYFCFLDGKLYRANQGSDGFKVLKIGSDYVILQTPIGRQTLYVKIP